MARVLRLVLHRNSPESDRQHRWRDGRRAPSKRRVQNRPRHQTTPRSATETRRAEQRPASIAVTSTARCLPEGVHRSCSRTVHGKPSPLLTRWREKAVLAFCPSPSRCMASPSSIAAPTAEYRMAFGGETEPCLEARCRQALDVAVAPGSTSATAPLSLRVDTARRRNQAYEDQWNDPSRPSRSCAVVDEV